MLNCKQQAPLLSHSFSSFPACVWHTWVGGVCVMCGFFWGGGIFSISVLTLSVSLVDHLLLSQAKKKNVLELQPLQFFYCCFLISWKYV